MLCDTYSVSSSRGVTVTLVRVREHQRVLTNHRGVIRRLQCAWRLFRATLHAARTTSPADRSVTERFLRLAAAANAIRAAHLE